VALSGVSQVLKFILLSLIVVLGLYAAGYFPAKTWDPPRGPMGLLSGLTLALILMAGSFIVMRWALFKSQRIFMTVFGVGFILRLVIVVVIFFLYAWFIKQAVASFALSFGVCYLALNIVEFLCLKGFAAAKKE